MSEPTMIRAAVPRDAGPMADLFIRAWREAYPGIVPDSVLAALDRDRTARWLASLITARPEGDTDVAESDGRIAGFVRYGPQPAASTDSGYVFGLYVDPAAAGSGIGQALLRHAEVRLRVRGCETVALHVFEANERARRLYAKSGYLPDGSSRVEPEYQANQVRLVKALAAAPDVPPRLTSTDGYPAVSRLLLRGLNSGVPPAIAMEVRTPAGPVYSAAGGWARLTRGGEPPVAADAATLFDLASLTKVVATLPLALLLHQRGAWSIDDPVARWLPGAPPSPVTISDCLLHTAGLVPFRQYYRTCADAADIRRAVIAELAGAVPGAAVSYSDVGFMLLGWAVEECAGEPLARLFAREVASPHAMTSTGYLPDTARATIAATEEDGDQRLGAGLVCGTVHDGNAFALGGVSGHAGLFGTAADLGRYAAALLRPDSHPVLAAKTIELITSRHAQTGDQERVLGWRVHPAEWGDWPAGTLWHTGFTGTSLLASPALDAAVVLLGNAVHPVRQPDEMSALRRALHQAVLAGLTAP